MATGDLNLLLAERRCTVFGFDAVDGLLLASALTHVVLVVVSQHAPRTLSSMFLSLDKIVCLRRGPSPF